MEASISGQQQHISLKYIVHGFKNRNDIDSKNSPHYIGESKRCQVQRTPESGKPTGVGVGAFSPLANSPPATGPPANGPPANGPPAKSPPLAANRPPVDCNYILSYSLTLFIH